VEDLADVVRDALAGDRHALKAFVDATTPIIQARVARALVRRASGERRDLRQEVEDMTQDVFAALFAHDGRALRAWDPARGLSLANFVGLIATRQVASILRSGRRNPWQDIPGELDELESASDPIADAEPQLESRRALERLLDRMREALSPRGLELFQRLYVDEEPIEEVAVTMNMTREAIYAWRNRTTKLLHRFASERDEIRPLDAADPRRTPLGTTRDE
jgi:RNA polymerase sigma factor (sigma-70 family)